jgi:hypothetical protein
MIRWVQRIVMSMIIILDISLSLSFIMCHQTLLLLLLLLLLMMMMMMSSTLAVLV